MPEALGVIGLGNMGEPIAANLLQAGYGVRVYNRTASKAAPLVARGAIAVKSPDEVATPGGIVLTMLANDQALEETCLSPGSFVEKLGAGGVHISLSTISPATARRLAEQHAKHKVEYLAAPVFGRPDAAAAKKLWICVSGPAAAKKRAEPIFKALGQGIYDFGGDPGSANVVKVCGNFLIAAAIEALAECLTLAEKNGVSKTVFAEMMGSTLFSGHVYKGYSKQIAEERFEPAGFRLVLGLKDISLALETAEASAMPLPLASLLRDRWIAAIAKNRGDMDWTAITLNVAEDAGLQLSPQAKTAR